MATEVKRRRGTTVEHSTFTGAVAELTVDLTKDTVVVHDGATQGGFPLLREDFSNVPTTAPFTNISLDTAIFDTTYTETGSETQGTLYWNSDEETISLVTNGESFELGQKTEIHVKNQTGAQINKGEVVYASGTLGNSGRILVTKMIADGTVPAKRIMGVAAENIANGTDGKIITFGKLKNINTSLFSDGDILYVSASTAGAFQNTEPSQASGHVSLPIAYVIHSHSNGQIFIRVTPIDENEYQDYDAGLQDISDLTPSDDTIIVGNGTNWVAESGDTARASLGLSIGTHVQAWDAQLDTLSGLSADQATAIVAVTTSEYQQLQNIDTVTISNTQWGYLGELDQSLTQASSPTFSGLTVDGLVVEDEIRTLQSDVIENHLEIESLQDNKVEVGFLFPDGDGQALGTGDNATFNTVTLGEQADSANEAVRADRDIIAGNGVTGGGDLTADRTLTLGTPSTTTVGGSNAVTTDSHTHALDLSGRSITLSDDSDAVITFDTNTQNLGADRTYTPTIADHASGQRGVLSIGAQTIFGAKSFNDDIYPLADVETTDFSSWFTATPTGWQISQAGVGDFRTLYIDELVAKAFTADVAQALAGTDILTKSVAKLYSSFVVPSVSGTVTITVEDLEGLDGLQVFESGDHVRARVVDSTSGLSILDVYGTVSSYSDNADGTQDWTLTITYAGASNSAVGETVNKGSIILDYGTSGDYYIERTVLDRSSGTDFSKVPYNRIVQWFNSVSGSPRAGDPDTNISVITQSGNLANLTSTYSNVSGFGFFGENTFLTGSLLVGDLSKAGNYFEYNGTDLDVVTDSLNVIASTIALSTDSNGKLVLGTDADNQAFDDGIGFYADGNSNFRIGSIAQGADDYISYDTTDGLKIELGGDDLSTAIAEIRSDLIDIYLADQSTFAGIQFLSGQITLKVGADGKVASARLDATGDESAITLRADFFDFQSNDIVILGDPNQDEGTEAKIALGSNVDTITVANTDSGFIASGAGEFKGYIDADNFIRLSSSSLSINSESFNLKTSNIRLTDSFDRTNSNITSSVTYSDTLQFSGIFLDSDNYLGHITDVDTSANSGYLFRVGGTTSNFLEVNEAGGIAKIVFDTFDLDATTLIVDSGTNSGKIALGAPTPPTAYNSGTGIYFDGTGKALIGNASGNKIQFNGTNLDLQTDTFDLESGNLHIDSQGTTFPSASSSPPATTGNQTGFDGSSWNATPLFINDKTTVKFYFDYDITTSGELEILLDVSTDNGSTYTNYTDSSTTAVINMSPEYCNGDADSGKGFEISVLSSFNNRVDQLAFNNPSGGRGSRYGRVAVYVYIAEIGDADAIRFQVAETGGGALPVCDATGIITQEFQSVTEINPSGVFVRLADAVVLANGDKYLDPELIT